MTEAEIERRVEKMVDHLDRVFLSGQMTQPDYDAAMRALDRWADVKRRINEAHTAIGQIEIDIFNRGWTRDLGNALARWQATLTRLCGEATA